MAATLSLHNHGNASSVVAYHAPHLFSYLLFPSRQPHLLCTIRGGDGGGSGSAPVDLAAFFREVARTFFRHRDAHAELARSACEHLIAPFFVDWCARAAPRNLFCSPPLLRAFLEAHATLTLPAAPHTTTRRATMYPSFDPASEVMGDEEEAAAATVDSGPLPQFPGGGRVVSALLAAVPGMCDVLGRALPRRPFADGINFLLGCESAIPLYLEGEQGLSGYDGTTALLGNVLVVRHHDVFAAATRPPLKPSPPHHRRAASLRWSRCSYHDWTLPQHLPTPPPPKRTTLRRRHVSAASFRVSTTSFPGSALLTPAATPQQQRSSRRASRQRPSPPPWSTAAKCSQATRTDS